MCGITGVFHRDQKPVDREILLGMTQSLVHRGPDEEGLFINRTGHVGLGHRRLSIIDRATGQQPLSNENDTVWVVFNGEIYNFQSLAGELQERGHRFKTLCDTEVIVHGYEEWGEGAVERFRGMFAFALWDEARQRLWLARDRIGKKPLYYALDEGRVFFGSEIKAILENPDWPREIDLEALSDFLSLQYIPSPRTIFKGLCKLPAAHHAVITPDRAEIKPYWDLSFEPDPKVTEERAVEELLSLLEEATRIRLISEVPLGAFLSGGVDSSAVVGLMARVSDQPVKTHSVSFPVAGYDEAHHARRVAKLFSTNHQECTVTPEAIRVMEMLSRHFDEPFADPSAIPTYYVSKAARERVTVSLSGDGGDENFAGYRRYHIDARENQVRRAVPAPFRKPLFRLLAALYPNGARIPRILRAKTFFDHVAVDPVKAYFRSMSVFQDRTKEALLKPEINRALGTYHPLHAFQRLYDDAPARDHLSRLQYLDMKTHLCEDILTKVDRASMAVSLEVRCPILDHCFMEYAARLPSKWKLRGMEGKYLFKKALEPLLPREILYRRKMGFAVPIVEWLRHDLREYGRSLVLEGEASQRFFREDFLSRIWREHQDGRFNWGMELFSVMMVNLWYRNFAAMPHRVDR